VVEPLDKKKRRGDWLTEGKLNRRPQSFKHAQPTNQFTNETKRATQKNKNKIWPHSGCMKKPRWQNYEAMSTLAMVFAVSREFDSDVLHQSEEWVRDKTKSWTAGQLGTDVMPAGQNRHVNQKMPRTH